MNPSLKRFNIVNHLLKITPVIHSHVILPYKLNTSNNMGNNRVVILKNIKQVQRVIGIFINKHLQFKVECYLKLWSVNNTTLKNSNNIQC